MVTLAELCSMARAAGASGESWAHWTASDAVQDAIETVDDLDTDAIKSAFKEGARENRIATWRTVWTTAPADYDTFGTETIEECGPWFAKSLRRVAIEPGNFVYQTSRYGSGLHSWWKDDPRVEQAKVEARAAEERVERKQREEKRAIENDPDG